MAERGRKKQKKRDPTIHVKPPLDFIESPLNGRKYYCTPVQAARRPFLASSLPVDDKEALKWDAMQVKSLEPSLNEHMFTALQFESENHILKSNCKAIDDKKRNPCRRSQRLRLKELKNTQFLFQTPQGTTPGNMKGEVILATETPDHELVMLARRREAKNRR
ncbi:uncharacterized protein [Montipora foliosa]|uniref:uncharacterized protein n=1 Tax=Montipora foliosa TaxID=591990 RepID=UPI0035F17D6C